MPLETLTDIQARGATADRKRITDLYEMTHNAIRAAMDLSIAEKNKLIIRLIDRPGDVPLNTKIKAEDRRIRYYRSELASLELDLINYREGELALRPPSEAEIEEILRQIEAVDDDLTGDRRLKDIIDAAAASIALWNAING